MATPLLETAASGAATVLVARAEAPPPDPMFPALTPQQVARIAAHGHAQRVAEGEVLVEPGAAAARFFIVTEGRLEILLPSGGTEEFVKVLGPGQFTGEVNVLSGRRGLARIRAGAPAAVIEGDRNYRLSLVQTVSGLR